MPANWPARCLLIKQHSNHDTEFQFRIKELKIHHFQLNVCQCHLPCKTYKLHLQLEKTGLWFAHCQQILQNISILPSMYVGEQRHWFYLLRLWICIPVRAEVRSSFITTTVLFGMNPRSHHKGATGRVWTGDQLLPILCHCQLGQDINRSRMTSNREMGMQIGFTTTLTGFFRMGCS